MRGMEKTAIDTYTFEDLRKLCLFRGCTHAEIRLFLRRFGVSVRKAVKGEIVVHEGEKAKWTMIVLKGTLELYDHKPNGEDTLVRVFEPGGFLGMTISMDKDEFYPCMIVTGEDAELLLLDSEKIRAYWYRHGFRQFYSNLLSSFSHYIWFCREKFAILTHHGAEERVLRYLQTRAGELGAHEFDVPFATSQQMADFLAITRTALSLAVKRLVARGAIAHPARSRFVLL